jgi:hypothetical protein
MHARAEVRQVSTFYHRVPLMPVCEMTVEAD